MARTQLLMDSGLDPAGYHVFTARVRGLIKTCDVPRNLRRATLAHLDATVLKGRPDTVDCFLLGQAMAGLPGKIPRQHLAVLVDSLRDLNKLPFMTIKGQPVS